MTAALDDPEIRQALETRDVSVIHGDAPVSEASVRFWCGVMGDHNPAYLDEAAAIEAGHGGVIAPPVMIHGYTLPTLLSPEIDSPSKRLRERFGELGYPGVVAVNYEQDYFAPIRIGDRLRRETVLDSISGEKATALGRGHFVTRRYKVINQNDILVGQMMVRTYYFRADGGKPRGKSAPAPQSSESAGIRIPPVEIPITATLVACGAIATNDFETVHHDRKVAQEQGMQDIFMNILTSSGLVCRYITDWAGPQTVFKRLAVRLFLPNFPGDTMTLEGLADRPKTPGEDAAIHVIGTNTSGRHIDAEVTVTWPQ